MYYTTTQLGPKQSLTPEGFLLCRDVAIARTGTQLYYKTEIPSLIPGPDGIIRVERTPDVVFHPATMASFEGKAVTIGHPTVDVTPANWSELAKGTMHNVRQGLGIENDLLIADLLITDQAAIEEVRDNDIREVSCGYDAGYQQIEPGRARQVDIIGNHLALVDKGRCGTRCAIGDTAEQMKKQKWFDRLRATFQSRDEAAFEKELTEENTADDAEETEEEKKKREESEKTSDALSKLAAAVDGLNARLEKLEVRDAEGEEKSEEKKDDEKTEDDADEGEAEKKDDDDKEMTSDAARQEIFARAEILSPGFQFPTFDAAMTADQAIESLCAIKRKALDAAYANAATRDAVAPLVAGRDLKTLPCAVLDSTFIGASEIVRRLNNSTQTRATFDAKPAGNAALNISALNRRNADFWKGRAS